MDLRVLRVFASVLGVFLGACTGLKGPPVAPVRPVTEEYWGTRISDPYRYMEDLKDAEVQKWMKGQAEYAGRVLKGIPGREALLRRIQELDAGAPYRIGIVDRRPNGDLYYFKTMAGENLAKFFVREGKTGAERLLIDPERFAKTADEHYSLGFCVVSPDGRYVAYGVARSGSEETVLRVLDVGTGKDLADVIDRIEAEYTPPMWLGDSGGFVYSRRRKLPADAPATEIYKQTYACLHRLGTDADRDAVLLRMGSSAAVSMSETDFPSIIVAAGSEFAIGKIKHGDTNELTLYAAPVASLGGEAIPWRKVCDASDIVTDLAVHGSEVYLLTGKGAPRYKVIRTSLKKPDMAGAETIMPPGEVVVQGLGAANDGLYVEVLDGGKGRVWRVGYGTANAEAIEMPTGMQSMVMGVVRADMDGAIVGTSSWTRAGRTYSYDPKTGSLRDLGLQPRGRYDEPEGLESEEVMVKSHDGVMVPLSVVSKKGIKRDGSNPALVVGYGGYGMVMGVSFSAVRQAWLERGGVLGIAHVRGGGEYGREWHLGGRKGTKANTWKDFIACCEHLVREGYTSPAKLAGEGGSAGGILIGRAITERPDLFAAAIIQVGCLDMLRFETTTNGVPNIPEMGTVKVKEEFEGLLRMSSYHHVRDGVKYPAVLLAHGINDPRVEPWMSAKMAARLQAATVSGKPVLLRVDYQSGHGIGSTKKQRQEQLADEWSFLLWQMGERGFEKS